MEPQSWLRSKPAHVAHHAAPSSIFSSARRGTMQRGPNQIAGNFSFFTELEREAAKKGHSLNTEMVERLEASFAVETQARDQNRLLDEVKGTIKSAIENMNPMKWLEPADVRRFEQLRQRWGELRELNEVRIKLKRLVKEGGEQIPEQVLEQLRNLASGNALNEQLR
jgi:Rad3-related DNA helicase